MRDSSKQQVLDACSGLKSAANIIGLLTSLSKKLRRDFPDDAQDSPRLRVTISTARLGIQANVSRKQAQRAINLLCARQFIVAYKSVGETSSYYVRPGALDRWVQPMELFEQNVPGTRDAMSQVAVTSCPRYQGRHVPGLPISSYNSSTSSGTDEDEQRNKDEKEARPQAQALAPLPDQQSEDGEREGIIQAYREIGIPPESTERLLKRYTRQLLLAGLAHLSVRLKRGDKIPRPYARFLLHSENGFLANPGAWGHEYDLQTACWVPSITLARRAKDEAQAKARDRPIPPLPSPLLPGPHWQAWDSLSPTERDSIKTEVDRLHPGKPLRVLELLYAQAALNRGTTNEQEEERHDASSMQGGDDCLAGAAARSQ